MKGHDIIKKLGVEKTHCALEKEMIEIDPEFDYLVIHGTDEHPRIICEHHEEMMEAGKYTRLRVEGREVLNDIEWTTGHNAFENDVEPGFSPKRPKTFVIK